jgi:hypothetical protein
VKRYQIALLSIAVALLWSTSSQSTAVWQPTAKPGSTYLAIAEANAGLKSSKVFKWNSSGQHLCSSVRDCLGSDPVELEGLFAPCDEVVKVNCIVQFTTSDEPGASAIVHELRQLSGHTVPADDSLGVTKHAGPTLALSEEKYVISVRASRIFRPNETSGRPNRFFVSIAPVQELTGSFTGLEISQGPTVNGLATIRESHGGSVACEWQVKGLCWRRVDPHPDTTYALSLRLDTEWGGYLRARIHELEVLSIDNDNGSFDVTISGKPQEVQQLFWRTTVSKWTQDQMETYCRGLSGTCTLPHARSSYLTTITAFGERPFDIIRAFRVEAEDSAAGMDYEWSVKLMPQFNNHPCSPTDKGFLGIVSTNAPVIEDRFPSYSEGSLSYKVAGFHYGPDGETVNQGTYDLLMRSDVARCIYGYSNAPISATIAVVGEQGEENIATTIVSEKDGWLKLAAYGFTFSEKEIQVQLRQSQIKTLTNFTSSYLSAKQKAEIRAVLAKSDGNTKFICTGIRYYNQPLIENIKVRARAKAACDYAKSINPNFSYWYQTKTTQARSYNGKVMVVSKS